MCFNFAHNINLAEIWGDARPYPRGEERVFAAKKRGAENRPLQGMLVQVAINRFAKGPPSRRNPALPAPNTLCPAPSGQGHSGQSWRQRRH